MTKQEMIDKMIGRKVWVDAGWLKKNDSIMLDWIQENVDHTSKPSGIITKLEFDEGGVRYYTTNVSTVRTIVEAYHNLDEQPPWGEDRWMDWEFEMVKKYYDEL